MSSDAMQKAAAKHGELEIVYQLGWRDRPTDADDRSFIVMMYDTPSTTLNFNTFKSYLVKNSGMSCEDVNVSYATSNDKEVHIKNQDDFHLALYVFRKRALVGEIIKLKLEAISKKPRSPDSGLVSSGRSDPPLPKEDVPPEWFLKYMKKFKKEVVQEVTAAMMSSKAQVSGQHSSHPARKSKRSRKLPLGDFMIRNKQSSTEEKMDLMKCKKPKAKKMIPKVSSDSDVTHERFKVDCLPIDCIEELKDLMDGKAAGEQITCVPWTVPHMMEEFYLHKFEVVNCGTLPWTRDTYLCLSWGSERLKPVETKLVCPPLLPGEKGVISVKLEVPELSGNYECYWRFYHEGRRFGHWLGFKMIVDRPSSHYGSDNHSNGSFKWVEVLSEKPDSAINSSQHNETQIYEDQTLQYGSDEQSIDGFRHYDVVKVKVEKSPVHSSQDYLRKFSYDSCDEALVRPTNVTDTSNSKKPRIESEELCYCRWPLKFNEVVYKEKRSVTPCFTVKRKIIETPSNVVEALEKMTLGDAPDRDCSSFKTVSQHDVHASDSDCGSSEGYVLVGKDDEATSEKAEVNDPSAGERDIAQSVTSSMEPELFTNVDNTEDLAEYAYIYYKGEKYPFHKKYLSDDYFNRAEKAVEPRAKSESKQIQDDKSCEDNVSRNSTPNSGNRLFVFPRHSPGFEVVYPHNDGIHTLTDDGEALFNSCLGEQSFLQQHSLDDSSGYDMSTSGTSCGYRGPNLNKEPSGAKEESPALIPERETMPEPEPETPPSQCSLNQNTPPMPERSQRCSSRSGNASSSEPNSPGRKAPSFHERIQQESEHSRRLPGPVPDNLISGAAMLASAAMNTARNVMDLVSFKGMEGRWEGGHWVSLEPHSLREFNLKRLREMGFLDRNLNATLLARYKDDMTRVVSELIH